MNAVIFASVLHDRARSRGGRAHFLEQCRRLAALDPVQHERLRSHIALNWRRSSPWHSTCGGLMPVSIVTGRHDTVSENGFAKSSVAVRSGPPPIPKPAVGFHGAVSEFKRRLIEATLTQSGGNRTRAAKALGLQRTYLLRLMREFQIQVPASQSPPRRSDTPPATLPSGTGWR